VGPSASKSGSGGSELLGERWHADATGLSIWPPFRCQPASLLRRLYQTTIPASTTNTTVPTRAAI
jgi:hypothetical protein